MLSAQLGLSLRRFGNGSRTTAVVPTDWKLQRATRACGTAVLCYTAIELLTGFLADVLNEVRDAGFVTELVVAHACLNAIEPGSTGTIRRPAVPVAAQRSCQLGGARSHLATRTFGLWRELAVLTA